MILTIIVFVLVLSALVFVHECGHFFTARKFGIKAEEFGFGFPPRAIGYYKDSSGKWKTVIGSKEVIDAKTTIYSINWIPIGGFVKIKGENGDNKSETDSFSAKPIWQRSIVISAGVIMNILFAAIVLSISMMIGTPQILEDINKNATVIEKHIQIIEVLPNLPAAMAGIKAGDVLISIDDNVFSDYKEVQQYVANKSGQELVYKIKRGDQEIIKKIKPAIIKETGKSGVGIGIADSGIVQYPWYLAIYEGFKSAFIYIWLIIVGFVKLIVQLVTGHSVSDQVAGPIGIATLTGQMARLGLSYVLNFMAVLSLNLAVINFLPFPAIDGGRLIFLLIEKIKGSPIKKEVEAIVHNAGFLLLMALVVFITIKDVIKLFK